MLYIVSCILMVSSAIRRLPLSMQYLFQQSTEVPVLLDPILLTRDGS